MKFYKLTTKDGYTRKGEVGETKWDVGKWQKPLSGKGDLCDNGWYHFYHSPDLAVLLNPIHAYIENPILWECECRGKSKDDKGLKIGWTEAKIVKKIKLPKWTKNQKIAFGILCAKKVYKNAEWNNWADNWLSGKDRTSETARAAAAATWAAAEAVAEAVAEAAATWAKKLNFNAIIKQAKKIK